MLEVVDLGQARQLAYERFGELGCKWEDATVATIASASMETVPLSSAVGRVIAHDVIAREGVPSFDRSTVDGFAVVAADTFGCSDALPALLVLAGEVDMGAEPTCAVAPDACVRIPTGGQVPQGADAVVMLEYCEEYGDGTIGVARPVAPGENIVFENDDVKPGQVLVKAGTRLLPHHIGTLASLGATTCEVRTRNARLHPRVAVISTGDEIVPVEATPVASQMRDVNAPMLAAAVEACGGRAVRFPIVPDRYDDLLAVVERALAECDMVLVSGGSSAGAKDNTARVLSQLGEILFHGIAVKPGKPTMCADVRGKPAFGLPGHPVAAYFMFLELVRPLLACRMASEGQAARPIAEAAPELAELPAAPVSASLEATLVEGLPSNHGRTELVAVRLERRDGNAFAIPVRGKSGLISQLSMADGYIEIPRNQEGVAAGALVAVRLF